MKDLYKRLKLSPEATREQIEFALQHCDNDRLVEDAEYILLNAARRTVYDRNYKALKLVGTLRNRMELESTPFWGCDEYRDFTGADMAPVRMHRKQTELMLPDWVDDDKKRFMVVFSTLLIIYAFLFVLFF